MGKIRLEVKSQNLLILERKSRKQIRRGFGPKEKKKKKKKKTREENMIRANNKGFGFFNH
jgi:hypothetical protein